MLRKQPETANYGPFAPVAPEPSTRDGLAGRSNSSYFAEISDNNTRVATPLYNGGYAQGFKKLQCSVIFC
jgi:hypothetical protein